MKKDHEITEDENGTIRHVIPMSDGLGANMSDLSNDEIPTELGRGLKTEDELFPEQLEHVEHEMVQAMQAAGIDPAIIHAFEETGLIVSEDNEHLISDKDLQQWRNAVENYRSEHEPLGVEFPIGTVAMYGPDDKVTTKIVAGVITSAESEPILERFVGTSIATDEKVQAKIAEFFEQYGVVHINAVDRNIGCPHEEGEDFPLGEDCPFCPHWKGKQGSAASIDEDEPSAEQAELLANLLQTMNPEMANELFKLAQSCESADEFADMVMIGPCPQCDSDDTDDCEDDPEIDDPCVGRCSDCGQLWCCDCDELFDDAKAAANHDCEFWKSLEELDDELDDDAPF